MLFSPSFVLSALLCGITLQFYPLTDHCPSVILNLTPIPYSQPLESSFGEWGLEILPVPGTEHFLQTFIYFIKPVFLFVMVANSPHYSPYVKSTCTSDHNVIFFLHHQVHDTLNDVTMMSPWCYNRGTYMSFSPLTRDGHICPSSPVRASPSTACWLPIYSPI